MNQRHFEGRRKSRPVVAAFQKGGLCGLNRLMMTILEINCDFKTCKNIRSVNIVRTVWPYQRRYVIKNYKLQILASEFLISTRICLFIKGLWFHWMHWFGHFIWWLWSVFVFFKYLLCKRCKLEAGLVYCDDNLWLSMCMCVSIILFWISCQCSYCLIFVLWWLFRKLILLHDLFFVCRALGVSSFLVK